MRALLFVLALLAAPALAGAGVVGTGTPGSCTEAAFDAVFFDAQNNGGGSITFDCGNAPHVIVLTYLKQVAADTEIHGGDLVTLSGGNATSIFQVYANASLTLRHLGLTRAYGPSGAIENFGTLAVYDSQLVDNEATGSGGAILNYGTATLSGGTVADNTAFTSGGAIAVPAGGDMTIDGTQLTGNQATDVFAQGGAVVAEGILTITGATFLQNRSSRGGALSVLDGTTVVAMSQFQGNWGAYGGAIRQEGGTLGVTDVEFAGNGYGPTGTKVTTGGGALSWGNGTATLTNVTIADNWASYGGGFDHESGTTTLVNVTISGNQAVGGGGFDQAGGTLALTNVTLADNEAAFFAGGMANRGGVLSVRNVAVTNSSASKACNQALASGNAVFSLASDFTCGMGLGRQGLTLAFAPLAHNGGFTRTRLPQSGNPVVDNGTGTGCPSTDQRGVTRPLGAACDVGAVEYTPPPTTTSTSTTSTSATSSSSSSSTTSPSTSSTSSSSSSTSLATSTSLGTTSTLASTSTTSSSTTTSTTTFVTTTTETSTTLIGTTVTSTSVVDTTVTTTSTSSTTLPACAGVDGSSRADCTVARLIAAGSCVAETPDGRLRKVVPKKVERIRELLARAPEAASDKAAGKLLRRADKKVAALGRRIERSTKTPAECRATLVAIVNEARAIIATLLPS